MVKVGQWPNTGFGKRLRVLRNQARLTQTALAARVGVAMNSISRLEREESVPTWPFVLALADALGVCVSEFRTEGKGD